MLTVEKSLVISKEAIGIMVVITITLIMMDLTVGLLHGMGIIGMRGFLITVMGIGHICHHSLTKNPMGIIVTMNRQATGITTALFITALLVGTMDIRIHISVFLTIVIHTDTIQVPMLTITTIRQATQILTFLFTTRVVLEE